MTLQWYVIIERSNRMAVLATGCATMENAWLRANGLALKYPDIVQDYDALFFSSEHEMLEFIMKQSEV